MTDATAAFPTLPPRPPANVVPTLFNQERRDWEESKEKFYCFLGTTKRAESPSSILGSENHELSDIMKQIFGYLKFKMKSMDEGDYSYKVKMRMCHGTENVFVEALANKGGWENYNTPMNHEAAVSFLEGDEFCGLLNNQTLGLPLHEEVIAHLAQLCNEDGSFYTEGQLRSHWKEIDLCAGTGMTPCMGPNGMFAAVSAAQLPPELASRMLRCEFCDGTSPVPEESAGTPAQFHAFQCNQRCMALPGDTIYWKFLDPYRIAFRWESATDEELVERGYVKPGMIGQQGHLFFMCQHYREEEQEAGEQKDDDDDDE